MPRSKSRARTKKGRGPTVGSKPRPARAGRGGFVGRDASPVLDRYPPRPGATPVPTAPAALPPAPPTLTPGPASVSPQQGSSVTPPTPKGLLSLERPFNLDEFSQLLGETTIRMAVPKEDLPEVLRRITDFMGFGIYVYAIQVRPAGDEMLRRFEVELQRVDFSPALGRWVPFEEKGQSDSPFGPSGTRT